MTLLEYMNQTITTKVRKSNNANYIRKIFKKKEELEALPSSDDVYDHLFFRSSYNDRATLKSIVSAYRAYCRSHGMTPDPINIHSNCIY